MRWLVIRDPVSSVGSLLLSAGVLLVAGVLLAPQVAQADCASPPPHLWSYPADGAEGVPTNAVLILSGSPAAVRLDGALLSPLGDFSYDLGELEPDTEYLLEFEATPSSGAPDFSLSFTTGGGPAETLSASAPEASAEDCRKIQSWQGCFDTERPETLSLSPSSGLSPVAWGILELTSVAPYPLGVWPSACGDIQVDTYTTDAEYELVPLEWDGPGEVEKAHVVEPGAVSGCSVSPRGLVSSSSSSGGLLALGALMMALFGRRVRRAGRAGPEGTTAPLESRAFPA